ncbi:MULTISPECIES: ABC transporter substrate-binding protein [Paenibacillus]|uniref:Carbohydrate ABC transporter substrate-binding protein (CUT1 family) n=1 Tax=Paenibacillus pabuli TaxID=1472 RepID=A0A855XWJ9_9BACL|nr:MULTISPECIES: ABC transporter substrate-binding protein [Paenibacillus]PWW42133.1 carbohydrate ABC transporter substrate-binding protein (CUT1 family) [Paenibacillus pabuli]PXW07521.1 carbohydrate ABC transporter substrate-binding protein (CUT1 family) [Paenibacillus taichungensis]RAI94716.1 carbohydrate ABC transporter substrate-binding protein (CUT1 family) [Paenibacillus pabuli]
MKRMTKLTLLMLIAFSVMLAGCGNGDKSGSPVNTDTQGGGEAAAGDKTIKIFQYKVEIAEAFNRLKAEYESSHPGIKLDIQTVGGGSDYGAALKAKFAAGEQPDIFNVGGYRELDTWLEYLEDLSGEAWAKDVLEVAKEPMTKDGKLYGQPLALEGYGFIYNKDLFQKAGITEIPTTLEQLDQAAQKLQAAGITPFSNGYQEWWVLGNHNVNVAFANQADPVKFIQGLNEGTEKIPGNQVFTDWMNLLDLTLKYSNKNPLTTDYNTQVTLFATGEAAMMQQGNWTQVQIDGIDPNLNLGILPMPITNEPNDKLFVGVPNYWVVNKNSQVKPEAKEFLEWLVTSDIGKQYMTKEFKFIPAFSSIQASEEDLGDLATDIMKYSQENKTLSWNFNRFPEGVPQEFGSTIQAYVAGKSDKKALLDALQQNWDSLKK